MFILLLAILEKGFVLETGAKFRKLQPASLKDPVIAEDKKPTSRRSNTRIAGME
jgi:hypothetical protein